MTERLLLKLTNTLNRVSNQVAATANLVKDLTHLTSALAVKVKEMEARLETLEKLQEESNLD